MKFSFCRSRMMYLSLYFKCETTKRNLMRLLKMKNIAAIRPYIDVTYVYIAYCPNNAWNRCSLWLMIQLRWVWFYIKEIMFCRKECLLFVYVGVDDSWVDLWVAHSAV